MSDLTDALGRILNWLEQHRLSDISFLQPGLSNAEIDELVVDLPLRLPKDIWELYQWKNGTRIIGDYWEFSCIFENWSFYPLQFVIDGFRDKIERYKKIVPEPIFEYERLNALNIFFCSELTDTGYVLINEKTQETSPVIFHSCKGGDCSPIIKYPSLTSMMLSIAECCENAYGVNTNGDLILDCERALQIWHKYNSYRITERD
jgi:hypothetical protein